MFRILFWNLNRQSLRDEVSALASSKSIDVLILAEDPVAPAARLRTLNAKRSTYFITPTACKRIEIYTAFYDRFIFLRRESPYYTFREIKLPARGSFLLVALHWKSLVWRSRASQTAALVELGHVIREEERECGHDRTIVTGDFNSEPFAEGMIAANGMHSVMSRDVASKGQRQVSPFGSFPFFYNPTWSVYGDESEGPPGTYFRSSSEEVCQYWHVYDQVLVRPHFVPHLPPQSVSVLTQAGCESLVDKAGRPAASDHLPLLFTVRLPLSVEAS